MIFIQLTDPETGRSFWLNPDAIAEMESGDWGVTWLTMKVTGKRWVANEKPSDVLDKIRKAREDEKREVEAEGT